MLAYLAGLPPIRLHDLRHGAATLLLAAGHDMKVVQETLGLSSITIAADTYTSVLPELARRSAEDVAALIRPAGKAPAKPGRTPGSGHSPQARRQGRPEVPPGRKVNTMTSSSQPPDLGQYLARRGFAPNPGNPTWLDLGTGQQTVRVLHEPGETTLLYCLDPAQRLPVRGRLQPRHPGRRDHRRDRSRAEPAPPQAGRGRARPATGQRRTREGKR